MRILMPHWYLETIGKAHLLPLMKSISDRLGSQPDSFHIAYVDGEPKQEWRKYFSFHKVTLYFSFLRSKVSRLILSRRRVYSQVKDIDVDVYFTFNDLWGEEFCRYCSSKKKVPYVVWLRGNPIEVRRIFGVSWLREKILNYLEIKSLKKADLVIPNSLRLAKLAEELGVRKDKITPPVHNGVDTCVFKPMNVERPNGFTVAYAGRISPEKGVQKLLNIADKLPNVNFLIAGKKQMNISFPKNVRYLGELPFSKMPRFYNSADIIVLPSLTEGFPSVILEAYACGKPVLATKESFPEELKIFGSVVNIEDFEMEIKRLMNLDLEPMGREAREFVKKYYTWDEFGRSILIHLKNVVS